MEQYCQATGLSLETAVSNALVEWYEVMGEAVVTYAPIRPRPAKAITTTPTTKAKSSQSSKRKTAGAGASRKDVAILGNRREAA
jgi:hypothetical protein